MGCVGDAWGAMRKERFEGGEGQAEHWQIAGF